MKGTIAMLLLLALMVAPLCGCMSENKTNKAERMKEIALEYLNENYDDNFSALGYSDGDWAYDYSTVKFTSDKYSEAVEVKIYEDNGNYAFKDNYFKLNMREDAENYFAALSSKYGYVAEVKVRFISSELPDTITNNANFAEYVTTEKCNVEVYFISNSDFAKSDIASILTDISAAKIMGNFRFAVTNDPDLLSQYSISEIVNEKAESVSKKESFTVNSNFEVVE